VPVAIAANVFVAAGVVLLFIINMNFTQRLLRAFHPRLVGNKLFDRAFLVYYVSILPVLIMGTASSPRARNAEKKEERKAGC